MKILKKNLIFIKRVGLIYKKRLNPQLGLGDCTPTPAIRLTNFVTNRI